MAGLDFDGLNAHLLARIDDLMESWLPGGRWRGNEYQVSGLGGGGGNSMEVNRHTGLWNDFATGERGKDLIALYAAIHNVDNGQAYHALKGDMPPPRINGHARPQIAPVEDPPPVQPPPQVSFEPSQFKHRHYGTPTRVWVYRTVDGDPLFVVARYDTTEGKQILPWTWRTGGWHNKGMPKPRPLYGLERLKLTGRVLIVEGEKSADAAQAYFPTRPCLTWCGGVGQLLGVDWAPLAGRAVSIWPDNDEPGIKAGLHIAGVLFALGCDVKLIDPKGAKDKWDAADALESGLPRGDLIKWLADRSNSITEAPVLPEPKPKKPERVPPPPKVAPAPPRAKVERVQTVATGEVIEADPAAGSLVALWQEHGFSCKGNGKPYAIQANVMRCLPIKALDCWYDEFTLTVMMNGRPYDDNANMDLTVWIQEQKLIPEVAPQTVMDGVLAYALRRRRHPLREWMQSLHWDGVPRIERLLAEGLGAKDSVYHAHVGRCFMIAMAARIFRPGCQHRCLPVFEGEQNQGKTKALAILGREYHAEVHEQIGSKDYYLAITGKLIVELSEMHAFKGAEIDKIKGIISTPVDRFRPPYGKISSDHPRSCVFAGTTNRDDWITDETGATRFWPVRTSRIDLKWVADNRDQLFAEAVYRFETGEDWWRVPEGHADKQRQARVERDPWHDLVMQYCEGRTEVQIPLIMSNCLEIKKQDADARAQHRIGRILRYAGWRNSVRWVGNKALRRWIPPNPADDPITNEGST